MEESSLKLTTEDLQSLKDAAFRLLTRREQSQFELHYKLTQKGWPKRAVEELLQQLAADGWQSDERFARSFARDKIMQGQGRLKIIAQATQQKGLVREQIEQALDDEDVDWLQLCQQVHERKFGLKEPKDAKLRNRQIRYLQQRGFSSDEIFTTLGRLER